MRGHFDWTLFTGFYCHFVFKLMCVGERVCVKTWHSTRANVGQHILWALHRLDTVVQSAAYSHIYNLMTLSWDGAVPCSRNTASIIRVHAAPVSEFVRGWYPLGLCLPPQHFKCCFHVCQVIAALMKCHVSDRVSSNEFTGLCQWTGGDHPWLYSGLHHWLQSAKLRHFVLTWAVEEYTKTICGAIRSV